MAKAVVRIGYSEFVMELSEAAQVASILADAEVYKEHWHREQNGIDSHTTYHVFEQENQDRLVAIKVVPDKLINMARLAGKPDTSGF